MPTISSERTTIWGRNVSTFFPRFAFHHLGPADRNKLNTVIANTRDIPGRSIDFPLVSPISLGVRTYQGVRCKGISPATLDGKQLKRHDGNGHDGFPVDVDRSGKVFLAKATAAPEGTCLLTRAQSEMLTTENLPWHLVDKPLGIGIYDGMSFEGESVGYSAFLMTTPSDIRLFSDKVLKLLKENAPYNIPPETALLRNEQRLRIAFEQMGRALARMHDAGFIHKYFHLDNAGLDGPEGSVIFIRDLDSARSVADMTPRQRLAHVMLDAIKTMSHLRKPRFFGEESGLMLYSLSIFMKHFLSGYLERPIDFSVNELDELFHPYRMVRNRINWNKGYSFDFHQWALATNNPAIRMLYEAIREKFPA